MTTAIILSTLRKKSDINDKLDFIVGCLRTCIGEPELYGSNDVSEVTFDFLAQFSEHRNPVSLNPTHPLRECVNDLIRTSFNSQT